MFVKVENGIVVKKTSSLPKAYTFSNGESTGNFDLLDSSVQIAEGYYPLIENKPTYNSNIQKLVLATEVINAENVTHNYAVQDIPIATLKASKFEEIENVLQAKLGLSQFTFDSQVFNFHQQAASDVTQLQTLLGLGAQFPNPFSWTQADGEEYPMDQVAFVQFANALATHKLGLIGTAKFHVASVKALINAQEIYDYDYSGGW